MIKPVSREKDKVVDGLRRFVGEKRYFKIALICFEDRHVLLLRIDHHGWRGIILFGH
jgi:hypothetical protein